MYLKNKYKIDNLGTYLFFAFSGKGGTYFFLWVLLLPQVKKKKKIDFSDWLAFDAIFFQDPNNHAMLISSGTRGF